MGSLASGIFSVMLGWIKSAASYVWNAASSAEGGSMLQWLADNWLTLTVILCAAGMVIDAVVHLLRWRSYKVWASFFRRITGRKQEEKVETAHRRSHTIHRRWVYADGTARTEAVEQEELKPEEESQPWQNVTPALPDYELDQEAYRRQFARPESQNPIEPVTGTENYSQEAQPAEPQMADEDETVRPPRRRGRISRETTRVAFQQLFASHDEDELDLRYKPAQPAMDKEQAYNKPYYPPQWKPPADVGTVSKDN